MPVARLQALIRRRHGQLQPELRHGNVVMQPASHSVLLNGEPLELKSRELALLELFLRHPAQVLTRSQLGPWDAVVLDLSLPERDGLDILRQWRAAGADIPVLILTARDALDQRVQGLQLGADDYLCKPFALTEVGIAPLPCTRPGWLRITRL
ncbi:hypothetical protein CRX72_00165 [Pantoea sp. BRM17]|nr:hypothetical protein CRX72_00165 [Pantoea sp. BRM17]